MPKLYEVVNSLKEATAIKLEIIDKNDNIVETVSGSTKSEWMDNAWDEKISVHWHNVIQIKFNKDETIIVTEELNYPVEVEY